MSEKPKRPAWKSITLRAGLGAIIALPFAPVVTFGFLSVIPTLPESHFLASLVGVVRIWQLLSLFAGIMFLGAAISLPFLAIDRSKRKYIPVPLGYLAVFMLSWPVEGPPGQWREVGLHRAANRGMSIVNALEEYKKRNNAYPNKLEALVPVFLPEIPHTGMVGHPKFGYHLPDENSKYYEGYRLLIGVSPVPMDFDYLFYVPRSPKNDKHTQISNVRPVGPWWYFDD